MSNQGITLDDCRCCEPQVPARTTITNQPGLAAISYRVGTQPVFKARMKTAIGSLAALSGLTARDDSDPAIGLVDAWAVVLDVLTFYQERLATEGYIRTATDLSSVYALAGEIGYLPNPGVAADVMLAFQLETAPGAPRVVTIPIGTKVQSLPDPKTKPQIFEAVEDVEARPEWNSLLPLKTIKQHLSIQTQSVVLSGTATQLKPGDGLLFVGYHRRNTPKSQHWDFRNIDKVSVDTVAGTTTVTWGEKLGPIKGGKVHPERNDLHIYAMRTRAGVFGFNAPDWRNMPDSLREHYGETTPKLPQWPRFNIYSPSSNKPDTIDLDAVYAEAAVGSYVVLSLERYAQLFAIAKKTEAARAAFALSAKTTRITLDNPSNTLKNFGRHVRDTVVHLQGSDLALADIQLSNPIQGRAITLDRVIDGLAPGRKLMVTGKRARAVVAARARGLELFTEPASKPYLMPPGESVQMTRPFTKTKLDGVHTWFVRGISVDGNAVEGTVQGASWKLYSVPALDSDGAIAEVVTLKTTKLIDGIHTRLEFEGDLVNCYDRASLRISANVVHGTHGESKQEILGSGDGSKTFQAFSLKQSPLTYCSSSDPSGGSTTLKVTVDDVAWKEVPTLYGVGPYDQAYIVRIGADGTVTVEFGDGITGARLPTGIENVKASYRVGIGRAGMVGADRITLLMTRPMGVRAVDNPVAAGVAADPEQLDSARQNAPQKVVTFDRVVSLTDYEDYARGFAGIAKAQAAWVWDGQQRRVHVTVAGTDGAPIADGSDILTKLVASTTRFGDPHQRFVVKSYEPVSFGVEAGISLEAGRDAAIVVSAVVSALGNAYAFARRSLGQPVFESDVIATIQSTPGVLAVDLTALYIIDATQSNQVSQLKVALPCYRARWVDGNLKPAQLVTIDPKHVVVAST